MPNLYCRIVQVKAKDDVRFNEILVGFKVSASISVFFRIVCIAHWCICCTVKIEIAFEWHIPEYEDMGTNQYKPMQENLKLLLFCYFCSVFGDITTIWIL